MSMPNNGLITQSNAAYYSGENLFNVADTSTTEWQCTFDSELIVTSPSQLGNFYLEVSQSNGLTWDLYSVLYPAGTITITDHNKIVVTSAITPVSANTWVRVRLNNPTMWSNYGGYEYVKINDIVDNFLVGYVGDGKLLPSVKRSDVLFHAKRGLQEFS